MLLFWWGLAPEIFLRKNRIKGFSSANVSNMFLELPKKVLKYSSYRKSLGSPSKSGNSIRVVFNGDWSTELNNHFKIIRVAELWQTHHSVKALTRLSL